MLHMQHHFLCNTSYVVIAESMENSLSIQQTQIMHNVHVRYNNILMRMTCKLDIGLVVLQGVLPNSNHIHFVVGYTHF